MLIEFYLEILIHDVIGDFLHEKRFSHLRFFSCFFTIFADMQMGFSSGKKMKAIYVFMTSEKELAPWRTCSLVQAG